jgi:hypothetical protein
MTWWFLLVGVGALIVFYAADRLARRGTGILPVNHGRDAHATIFPRSRALPLSGRTT